MLSYQSIAPVPSIFPSFEFPSSPKSKVSALKPGKYNRSIKKPLSPRAVLRGFMEYHSYPILTDRDFYEQVALALKARFPKPNRKHALTSDEKFCHDNVLKLRKYLFAKGTRAARLLGPNDRDRIIKKNIYARFYDMV